MKDVDFELAQCGVSLYVDAESWWYFSINQPSKGRNYGCFRPCSGIEDGDTSMTLDEDSLEAEDRDDGEEEYTVCVGKVLETFEL